MWIFIVLLAAAIPAFGDNVIQRENAKPGSPDWRLSNEANAGEIEGFASATSVNRGQQIRIYVNTIEPSYTIRVYRLGWYGGIGGRRVLGPVTRTGIRQPIPSPDPTTGLVECRWTSPYVITVPDDPDPTEWASGFYVALLTAASGVQKYVLFVVRDDSSTANHFLVSSSNTSEAYNAWGGKSLYAGNPQASKVSFNRPFTEGSGTGQFLWRWEYTYVRFLEREGYDVTYATDVDLARRPQLLTNHRDILFAGHPEYWSWEMRANTENAIAAGVSVGFFSSNSCYWQMRYESSPTDGAADRTIVSYKETALTADPYAIDSDRSNDHLITTLWRGAPLNRPEAALAGVQYVYFPVNSDIVIDNVTSEPWVFAGTGLTKGSRLAGLLGYEVDAMAPSSPPGTVRLGHSPYTNTDVSPSRTEYADMTVYTSSGATVFGAGTMQWAWGLDDWNSGEHGNHVNAAAQQMTRNILLRFAGDGAPADCQYTVAPTSAEHSPAAGTGSITLTTAPQCTWTNSDNASWLTITSSRSGAGNATIAYRFTQNPGGVRTGTITIGDKRVTVTQSSGCSFTVSPTSAAFGPSGGKGTLDVQTSNVSCTWTAVPSQPWLSIAAGSSGTGSGTVEYVVAPNSTPGRTGEISVEGATLSIAQSDGCEYVLNTSHVVMPSSGGSGLAQVNTDTNCFWTAESHSSWLMITSDASGRGTATVSFSAAPNATSASRLGSLSIAGKAYTVSQAAAGAPVDLTATATSTTSVHLTWSAVPGTARYDIARSANGSFFNIINSTTSATQYTDSGLDHNTAYLYEVRAIAASGAASPFSNIDVATTVHLVDDPLAAGMVVKARHLIDLRNAIAAIRRSAGLTSFTWSTPSSALEGSAIRAADIFELRAALDQARDALGLPAITETGSHLVGTAIRTVHLQELRSGVK